MPLKVTVQQDGQVTIEKLKVSDRDGNQVPFDEEDLNNLRIYIGDESRPPVINFHIVPQGFAIPTSTPPNTKVTIEDCASDCSDELSKK